MADFPILTSADGSTSINVGSVMLADGVDYGMAPMFANGLGGNPFVDGGQLGYRYSGPRLFKFPIRLATVGNMTPAGVARAFRQMAQSGAYVDLMLAGVATADAVRFDVIDGRVRESQDVKMWAGAGRREGVLELDVQPYGYLPTWIILASVPSIALPGSIPIPASSMLGDLPGLAQISVWSNLPSQQIGGGVGTYGYDAALFTLANKMGAFIPAASMNWTGQTAGIAPTLMGDAAAPGSQILRMLIVPSVSILFPLNQGWAQTIYAPLNATSSFGRYRLHAFARSVVPSWGGAIPIAADISIGAVNRAPTGLASGGIIASVGQPLTLASDGAYMPTPTGFGFYPLGDIAIPTVGPSVSGIIAARAIRLWANIASTGIPTMALDVAGLWLQSIDGANGVITRDLQNPNAAGSVGWFGYGMYPFTVDGYARDVQAAAGVEQALNSTSASRLPLTWMGSQIPQFSMLDRYRGVFPQVSPSMTSIEVMLAARRLQVSYRNEILTDTPKVWWRFNEPSGASAVLDWSGNGVNGLASNMLLGASSLLYGEPGGATMATGFADASSAALPAANAARTLEAWYQPATSNPTQPIAFLGASAGGGAGWFGMVAFPSGVAIEVFGAGASFAYLWQSGRTYHLAAAYSGTHVAMYVNGQGLGTSLLPAAENTSPRLAIGAFPNGAVFTKGGIDEVAVYASALPANRILAHYLAGRNTQGATSPPVYHQGGFAGVSVRYQPRFAFQKEL